MKLFAVIIGLIMFFPVFLFSGWIIMLIFGALGGIFTQEWMLISFWDAVIVSVCFSLLSAMLGSD